MLNRVHAQMYTVYLMLYIIIRISFIGQRLMSSFTTSLHEVGGYVKYACIHIYVQYVQCAGLWKGTLFPQAATKGSGLISGCLKNLESNLIRELNNPGKG